MRESKGDLFTDFKYADAICITTNGFVKTDGACVMGRGCAKEARDRFERIDLELGSLLQSRGNHVHGLVLPERKGGYRIKSKDPIPWIIFSFPVKEHWRDEADIKLIRRSARELMAIINGMRLDTVVLPRPGCGNGRLEWKYVKSKIDKILDNRVTVITND